MCQWLPGQVVVADEHQVLEDGQEVVLSTGVLRHTMDHAEHIPHISGPSQGPTRTSICGAYVKYTSLKPSVFPAV